MSDATETPASLSARLTQLRDKVLDFSKPSYALTVQTTGNGAGTVSRTPDAESYDKGQVVSLIARAESGSRFVRWLNDGSGSHPVCNVRMDSGKSVLAEFELGESKPVEIAPVAPSSLVSFALKVKIIGTGSGIVRRNPDAEYYAEGQVVSLTAIASEGSIFIQWMNDAKGSTSNPDFDVEMNSAKLVFARFMPVEVGQAGKFADALNVIMETKLQQIETRQTEPILLSKSDDSITAKVIEQEKTTEKYIDHSNHFIDNGDGTVTDVRSGLMWMRPALGQIWKDGTCKGDAAKFFWSDTKFVNCDFAGYNDWRLPTIDELDELIYIGFKPALDEQAFPNQSGRYFFSSSPANSQRLIFDLRSGTPGHYVNASENVRLVRLPLVASDQLIDSAAARAVVAEFEALATFALTLETQGDGEGSIVRSFDAANTLKAAT